ncbi:MAG: vWA domain-containing protein [Baekduia sp.]
MSVGLSAAFPVVATAAKENEPITAVVLVDESGSLSEQDIADERDAAAALVSSDLSTRSKFLVAGFGSANGAGQNAVTPYCDFITTANRAARVRLVSCANQVRVRKASDGNDTDHAKAIQFAQEALDGDADGDAEGSPVIFLMTDGVLDVRNSPSYGRVSGRRDAEAQRLLREELLPAARKSGTQIWPLGFGAGVSKPSLDAFAAGGAGISARCPGSAASRPHATIVSDTAEVIHSLVAVLGAARCGQVGPAQRKVLGRGGTSELTVEIPPIATDGAITVVKSNPTFRVEFFSPNGDAAPDSGGVDGQTFARSGVAGRVETLQITDPLPGRWRVKVTDPRRRAVRSPVSAFVLWEGSLQASVLVSPLLPVPGRPIDVEVRVLSRGNEVLSGDELKGVRASAVLTGSFSDRLSIHLDREGSVFRGKTKIPTGASGAIRVLARVSGQGVSSDARPFDATIQIRDFLSASFDFKSPEEVHPGDVLRGTVTTDNAGPPRRGRLTLGEHSKNALLAIDGPVGEIPTGTKQFPFTVEVSRATPRGSLYGTIYLTSNGRDRIAVTALDTEVVAVPGFWSKHWKLISLLALVLALAATALVVRVRLARRRRAEATDTRELTASLWRSGQQLSSLDSDGGPLPRPRFVMLLDAEEEHPHLRHPDSTAGRGDRIVVERNGSMLHVTTAASDPIEVDLGVSIPLVNGLDLRIARRVDGDGPQESASAGLFGDHDVGGPWPAGMTDKPTTGAW